MIWLLRHGDAEDALDDDERALTDTGREQGRAAGLALAALGVRLDACLTSPKRRAAEMAGLACEPLGVEVTETPELSGGPFDPLGLATGLGDVLLVGHEPDLSMAIARLTGARVDMKKGAVAAIDDRELVTLLRPEALALIAR